MSDFSVNGLDPKFYLDRLGTGTPSESNQTNDDFSGFLKNAISEVNSIQKNADEQFSKVIDGKVDNIHNAMIELQKADISFQVMMQIRNKILEAYQEIMRMQA